MCIICDALCFQQHFHHENQSVAGTPGRELVGGTAKHSKAASCHGDWRHASDTAGVCAARGAAELRMCSTALEPLGQAGWGGEKEAEV